MINSKHAGKRRFYGLAVAAAGFVIWFIGWGGYAVCFGLFIKPISADLHWTRTQISSAYAFSFIVQSVFGIVTGWLTDKLGPRIVVVLIGSCLGWSLILMSQATTLLGLYFSYALLGGIGASVLNIPVMATVCRWFIRRRGLVTGLVQAGAGFGGFFLAPFTGWLILNYGWRQASLILGLMTSALIILSGLMLIKDPKQIGQLPDGLDIRLNKLEISSKEIETPSANFALKSFIKNTDFLILVFMFSSFGYFRSFFTVHFAPHVQDLGFSLIDAARSVGIISFTSIIGRILMGQVADVIGNKKALILSFVLTTLIIIWLINSQSLTAIYIFSIGYGFVWGALAVLRFAITAEVFGLSSVGLVMGIFLALECLAATIGSYLGGVLYDQLGNYQTAFMICAVLTAMAIILTGQLHLQAGSEN